MARRLDADERERFTHVPARDLDRARLVTVPVLTPGVAGMTLGRWILLRRGHEHDRDLIAHELVHVRQWRELGVVPFLARYLGAYARGRWRRLGHKAAYEAIPLEVEARRTAAREPLIEVRIAHSDARVRELADELIAALATAMASLRSMVMTGPDTGGAGEFDTARKDHEAAMAVAERLREALVQHSS